MNGAEAPLIGKQQINQRAKFMDLMIALQLIMHSTFETKHNISTHSKYVINCFTQCVSKGKQNDLGS